MAQAAAPAVAHQLLMPPSHLVQKVLKSTGRLTTLTGAEGSEGVEKAATGCRGQKPAPNGDGAASDKVRDMLTR